MKLTFVCDCGNQVAFFGTGMPDEDRREIMEPEDDDRLQVMVLDSGLVLTCRFCNQGYRLQA
ncbi:hypothetical protein [Paenibacillus sp. 1P07SE]|uniref:hypothetical protein n=1 Tax=Paenibacillus sp. 1P07SE TaxID=3132209 RepID=UPI0039A5F097